jgi:DNA topoisomerase-1
MEDLLDAISRNEFDSVAYLTNFYFGQRTAENPGLKAQLDSKLQEVDARELSRFSLGHPAEGPHREEVFVRVGKYGSSSRGSGRRAFRMRRLPTN